MTDFRNLNLWNGSDNDPYEGRIGVIKHAGVIAAGAAIGLLAFSGILYLCNKKEAPQKPHVVSPRVEVITNWQDIFTNSYDAKDFIASYKNFEKNADDLTLENRFKTEEKFLSDIVEKASASTNSDPVLNAYYNLAESYYNNADEEFSKKQGLTASLYQKTIDTCTKALSLIKQKNTMPNYKDDFLYMRGQAKTHTGDLDGAVNDFLGALANLGSDKDPNDDQGIENQTNLALYQLLSGRSQAKAKVALQSNFRAYNPKDRQKILKHLWQEGPRNTSYKILTGKMSEIFH